MVENSRNLRNSWVLGSIPILGFNFDCIFLKEIGDSINFVIRESVKIEEIVTLKPKRHLAFFSKIGQNRG